MQMYEKRRNKEALMIVNAPQADLSGSHIMGTVKP